MRVVAVVRTAHAVRLERALNGIANVHHCASRLDCYQAIARHRPHALVVDPALLGYDELASFVREQREARIPIVFYLSLVPEDVAAVLPLLIEEGAEILLADIDDSGRHIRTVFARLPDRSIQADLFASAAELLIRLPPAVGEALAVLLLEPEWSSTKELPARVGISRRTIDRALRSAGLAPLQKWSSVSHMGRAFDALWRGVATEADAARIAGYEGARSLRRAAQSLLRLEPSAQLRDTSRAEFIERALAALTIRSDSDCRAS